jgi:hypothetical protein
VKKKERLLALKRTSTIAGGRRKSRSLITRCSMID